MSEPLREDQLARSQKADDFVEIEHFTEERTVTVGRFKGWCRICGWEGHTVDSPHSNTVFWEVRRHVEREHGWRFRSPSPPTEGKTE